MSRNRFLKRLEDGPLLCDGAMGTLLYSIGTSLHRCFDELNVTKPDIVRGIHRDYLQAGAELIETNTFGANRLKLLPHGLEDRVAEVNRAGIELAREAVESAGGEAFVAGSIGPLGKPLKRTHPGTEEEIAEILREQIAALVEAGADLLILETFSHLDELLVGVRTARDLCDLPIVAQMSFMDDGTTIDGDRPTMIPERLAAAGADVVGSNCSFGPKPMLETLEAMAEHAPDIPLSAQPNAGYPEMVSGRWIYVTSPEYMAEYARRMIQSAGVRLVGGCCGTTPDHIRSIGSMVKAIRPRRRGLTPRPKPGEAEPTPLDPVPLPERSRFARGLLEGRFRVSVEMNPPRSLSIDKFLAGARRLKEAGVDAINIPDGARATARIGPLAMSVLVQQQIGLEVLLHYCCRDRNLLGMQSDLLGAHTLGIRNLIIITGDPPKMGDYPTATAVFDVDSIGLTEMVQRMNHGLDLQGRSLKQTSAFFLGVGVNPGAINLDEEIRRFRKKIDAGAECAYTQPVFDLGRLEEFLRRTEGIDLPIVAGILPLTSDRNAEFFHNEVPGMDIPEEVRRRMARVGSGRRARAEGVAIARDAFAAVREHPRIRGAYIMPPLGRYEMALKVIEPFLDDRNGAAAVSQSAAES
ncbi:MAG: bifunctional homocysteine S-methyltransferase/methylenetetrahydrofolate reductase [Candidatus Eisenbacteria bacterium]|nr:bifunctional homocysteine S-methyltransferase/methylenetetrahydrofolate reductase [Candidatus Eisenbacteria bacterium]